MTLLMRPRGREPQSAPRLRGRNGVAKIVRLVPKYEKHTLEWWLAHITEHWETGG